MKLAITDKLYADAICDTEAFAQKKREVEAELERVIMAPVTALREAFAPIFEQQAEMQRRVSEMLAPSVRAAEEIARIMRPHLEHAAQMQKMMEGVTRGITMPMISPPPRLSREAVVYVPRSEPAIVRFHPDSVEDIVKKVVAALKSEPQIGDNQKESTTPKSTVDMPDGATWNNTELRFADAHTLRVLHKEKSLGSYDYAALGFARENTKEGLHDKQWDFLTQLSVFIEMKGVAPTIENLSRHLKISRGACEKRGQNLSKQLQMAFGINSDPFHKYDSVKGYRPKFALKPEPLLRGDGEVHRSGGSLLDWKEHDESDEDLLS